MYKEEWIDGYEPLYEKERNEGIQKVLDSLTSREQETLKYRYYDELKWREIGPKLKICAARARQIEKKGLRRLRMPVRLKLLAEYEPRAEIWIKRWERDDLVREKEAADAQIQWELKQKERQQKAHVEYLKEVERRQQEYADYQKNAHRLWEERRAQQLERLNNIIDYYGHQHKKLDVPPTYVSLIKKKNGEDVLGAQKNWEGPLFPIDTSSDPETYERWLKHLLEKRTQ